MKHRMYAGWLLPSIVAGACSSYQGTEEPPDVGPEAGTSIEREAGSATDGSSANPDASSNADANADALAPPSDLARPPKLGCSTVSSDQAVAAAFPGWSVGRFAPRGVTSTTEVFRCAEVLALTLTYSGTQVARGSEPALTLHRALPLPMGKESIIAYTVEDASQPFEEDEALFGGFALSTTNADGSLTGTTASVVRRPVSGEVALVRTTFNPNTSQPGLSLGIPTLPYRIEWTIKPTKNPNRLITTVSLRDRASTKRVESDDAIGSDVVEVSMGINRVSPGSRTRMTLSDVSLP